MTDFEFIDAGNGDYAIVADAGETVIYANRVRWSNDELLGEVKFTLDGGQAIVGPCAISFLKPSSRRDAVAEINNDVVAAALNELCRKVIECERENTSPIVRLCEEAKPLMDREYTIDLLPSVPRHHMSIWFGDGGVGKSMIALYAAGHLARQGINVLYLDWELEVGEHRLRYEQIFGEAMPSRLWYWRCDKPLKHLGDAVRRAVNTKRDGDKRVEYVVADSIAFACGGGAETSDAATEYANLVRSFGVGSLHLAHMTKGGEAAKMKPFGSVFWHSSARSSWYIENAGNDSGIAFDTTKLALFHRKSNFGPLERPRQLQYSIGKNRGAFRLSRPPALSRGGIGDGLSASSALADRILATVRAAPLPRADVKAALGLSGKRDAAAFRQAVKRLKDINHLREQDGVMSLGSSPWSGLVTG